MNKILSVLAICIAVFCSIQDTYAADGANKAVMYLDKFRSISGDLGAMEKQLSEEGRQKAYITVLSLNEISMVMSQEASKLFIMQAIKNKMNCKDDSALVSRVLDVEVREDMLRSTKSSIRYANQLLLDVNNVEIGKKGEELVKGIKEYQKYMQNIL